MSAPAPARGSAVTKATATPRLGLVTIGQSPRVDLVPDVADALSGVVWVEHGALDPLSPEQITHLAPGGDERALVSRLRDGGGARLGATSIAPHLDRAIAECVADGCGVVLVLCTGRVEHGPAPVPVLHAEDLAHEAMAALLGERALGVVCPVPEQLADVRQRWSERLGRQPAATDADPYTAGPDEIVAAGKALTAQGASLIFLDCIGYTEEHARLVASVGVPTYTARGLAVRAALSALLQRRS
jgi:protein AroM